MLNNQELDTSKGISQIIETDSIRFILPYLQKGTLVASDFDNTLIEPKQQLGSSQWDNYVKDLLRKDGKNEQEIEDLSFAYWNEVQPLIKVRCLEDETPAVIRAVQDKEADFIVLTARRPAEIGTTLQQISVTGIPLNKALFAEHSGVITDEALSIPAYYQDGILLSTGLNKKSDTLQVFFNKVGYYPKRLIFLDDKWNHVHDMQELAHQLGIEYIGIRFSGADKRVEAFDPSVTDIQYQALPTLLSDEEAKSKINENLLRKLVGSIQL